MRYLSTLLLFVCLGCGTPPASSTSADLRLLSHTKGQEGHYATVVGEVENLSDRPLERVQVLVTWYDKGGKVAGTESALIASLPLQPKDRSAFKVMTRNEGLAFDRYRLAFSSMKTGAIRHTER